MYVYDVQGRKVQAAAVDAKEMVAGGEYTTRFPKGKPEEEQADLQRAEAGEAFEKSNEDVRVSESVKLAQAQGLAPATGTLNVVQPGAKGTLDVKHIPAPKATTKE